MVGVVGIQVLAEESTYLDSAQDDMSLAGDTDNNGTLLHSLAGIFNLEYSALGRTVIMVSDIWWGNATAGWLARRSRNEHTM